MGERWDAASLLDSRADSGRTAFDPTSPAEWWRRYVHHYGSEPPSHFARALAETIPIDAGRTRLLDVGCGSGIIGIYALLQRRAASVTFSDIMGEWTQTTTRNLSRHTRAGTILESQFQVLPAAPFTGLSSEIVHAHDLISFNRARAPPQLPHEELDDETRQALLSDPIKRRFREGGPTGLEVVERFLDWYANLPRPVPPAVLVLSSFLNRRRIESVICIRGFEPELIAATRVLLRPIFWRKASLLPPAEKEERSLRFDGHHWTEDLLTIRLRATD